MYGRGSGYRNLDIIRRIFSIIDKIPVIAVSPKPVRYNILINDWRIIKQGTIGNIRGLSNRFESNA